MNAFLDGDEVEFRGRLAGYFRDRPVPDPAQAPAAAEAVWRDLAGPPEGGAPSGPGSGLSRRVLLVDEASRHDPKLGRDLLAAPSAPPSPGPVETAARRLAQSAGTATHVLEAGARAARERGFYSSSLMGFREVQERLAGLASAAALARLGAFRLCRLLDRGEAARADREAAGLLARAGALAADVRALATELLGPTWVEDRLPASAERSPDERTHS